MTAPTFEDGAWYWVEKEGWIGDPPTIAPALYKAQSDAWYSFAFSGIPTREVKVLEPCRRAPAVPVPQKGWRYVPEVLTPEMKREFMDMLMDGIDIYMNSNDQIEIQTDAPRRIWKSILAAAPQPPEADHIPDTGKMVAAPVELPEPIYTMRVRGRLHEYTPALQAFELDDGEHNLYTEHQVRQLLAAHSIKEQST